MLYRILFFLCLPYIFSACVPLVQSRYLTKADITYLPESYDVPATNSRRSPCQQWSAYVPDTTHLDHTPMRYVRVNFHWMNTTDTLYTLGEFQAKEYSRGLVRAANYDLIKNRKMQLPHTNNNTPVLPTRYRIVLTPDPLQPRNKGIYFHYDDELAHFVKRGKDRNLHKRDLFKKYAVQGDSVLNVFIIPHHKDSLDSPTYGAHGGGVALGYFIKLFGVHQQYKDRDSYWDMRGSFNHEIGHIYSLMHTWGYNDGCEDTPRHHGKCFHTSDPGCDTLTSNNVMDYGCLQNAWTPCQIGKIHARMSKEGNRQRNFLQPNWCTLKDSMSITIRDTVHWVGAKDLEGHLTVAAGGMLSIGCRISMPPGGVITVEPGGTLLLESGAKLHNACGQRWKGIQLYEDDGEVGQVLFTGTPSLLDMENELPPEE